MTMEKVKNLLIELVDLEAQEKKYKDLLGQAYTEIDENYRNKIELETLIIEQRIKEIRDKLDNTKIE